MPEGQVTSYRAGAVSGLIFTGSDTDIDITGDTGPVQRFRRLISTMATVVPPV